MKALVRLLIFLVLVQAVWASDSAEKPKSKRHKKAAKAVPSELQTLREQVASQQQQLQQMQNDLQKRDAQLQDIQNKLNNVQSTATQAQSTAQTASQTAEQANTTASGLQGTVKDLSANNAAVASQVQEEQKRVSYLESPLALHYKGITITPGGFLAGETVWRQRAEGADINTDLKGIPFTGASAGQQSEFFGSGRQSRLSLLAEGKVKSAKMSGYYEMDWLGAGVTSNNNQSNSYVNRMRQLWGQLALNSGWSFTGGQMWSLVTETKNGVDNRTEATPLTIDPQYTVGFSWARQYGFRIAKNFNNKAWAAVSVENPQSTVTVHNQNNNFVIGNTGDSSGLYNNSANASLISPSCASITAVPGTPACTVAPGANATYSFNKIPDVIGKLVFQPGFGHYEIFGIFSDFRSRIYPCALATAGVPCIAPPSAQLATNASTSGGGGGANARWSFFNKHIDLGAHFLGGTGVGRYGDSGLPDATVRPDGTLALLTSYQGLGTLEYHAPMIDIYFNGGVEQVSRSFAPNVTNGVDKPSTLVGYGLPNSNVSGCGVEAVPTASNGFSNNGFYPGGTGTCNADNRELLEGSVGFWYKLYSGPKGRIQFGPQYSYLTRKLFANAAGQGAQAVDNMFFTSFRYYLP
jgi:archaellum component FlaC